MMKEALKKNDIVICTALILVNQPNFNRRFSKIDETWFIYDLAAEQGGNSAYSGQEK